MKSKRNKKNQTKGKNKNFFAGQNKKNIHVKFKSSSFKKPFEGTNNTPVTSPEDAGKKDDPKETTAL